MTWPRLGRRGPAPFRSRLCRFAGDPGKIGCALGGNLLRSGAPGGGAPQHLHLGGFRKLIKRIGFASRRDVHVQLDTGDAVALEAGFAVLLGQFLELLEGLAGNQRAQLNPPFRLFRRADPDKTLLALQDLHAVPVLNRAHAVVDGGEVVAQVRLRC